MEPVKILLITQARVGSTRLPNKVTKVIGKTTLLGIQLERIKEAKKVTKCLLATTYEEGVENIIEIANQAGIEIYQGDLNDVLDRFYKAALQYDPDYVVRITSDCPLIDPELIDSVISLTLESEADYGANILIEEYPDGQDVEVFTFQALEKAWKEAKLSSEREHVTPFIRGNSSLKGGEIFKSVHLSLSSSNFNHIRMTVDEPDDLEAIETLTLNLGFQASWLEYTNYIIQNLNEFKNQDIQRNEGFLKSIQNDKTK